MYMTTYCIHICIYIYMYSSQVLHKHMRVISEAQKSGHAPNCITWLAFVD